MEIFEKISELEKACFNEPWTEESIKNQLSGENSVFTVSEDNGNIIGYAFGTVIIDEGELYRIAVSPEKRGKGTGERLLREFVEKCRNNGAVKLFLEVRSRNVPARRLYEKIGFKEISVRRGYYGDDDAVIYVLEKIV